VPGLEQPPKNQFHTACFWVKAYDIPIKKQTIACAQFLSSKIGKLVGCDEATMYGVKVDIDIITPLIQSLRILVDRISSGLALDMSNYSIFFMVTINWIMFF